MVNLCYDDLGQYNLGYPNLAQLDLDPSDFDHVWPRTTPLRLLMYFKMQGLPTKAYLVKDAPAGSWYPVSLSWHDFNCDYFSLMHDLTLKLIKQQHIRVLFYYHEGDDPDKIKSRIDYLCQCHDLPLTYLFVSANSAARHINNFFYFPDHEYFFRFINRNQSPRAGSNSPVYDFCLLNRTHKRWRANITADL